MKIFIWLLLAGCALAITGACLLFSVRWYGVTSAIESVSVINSKDEVFAFIEHDTAVLTERKVTLYLKQLTAVFLIPQVVSADMLVVHFKDGKSSKCEIKGFGSGGSAFVFKGEIYWKRGRMRPDDWPYIWKWNGISLVALSEAEISRIGLRDIKDSSAITEREGWNKTNLLFGSREPKVSLHLENGDVTISLESDKLGSGINTRDRVLLFPPNNSAAPETLIDIIGGYQEVSKEVYLRTKKVQRRL